MSLRLANSTSRRSIREGRRCLLQQLLFGAVVLVGVATGQQHPHQQYQQQRQQQQVRLDGQAAQQQPKPGLNELYDLATTQAKGRVPVGEKPALASEDVYVIMLEKGKELRYASAMGSDQPDDKEALEIFMEVAYSPKGGPEKAVALHEAALIYATGGKGVEQDLAKAVKHFAESAQLGFAEAKHTLAFFLATGYGNKPVDDATAITFEEPAAEGGSMAANLAMGFRYMYGAGASYNCSGAMLYYKEVASIAVQDKNHYADLILRKERDLISLIESRNAHGKSDKDLRAYWLKEAGNSDSENHLEALYEVGKMYDTGAYGMAVDTEKAFDFFTTAAEKGHTGAMTQLGLMLALPRVTPAEALAAEEEQSNVILGEDLDIAIDWLEKAATQGDAEALNALAYMYMHGKGVDVDVPRAQSLYAAAAELNHPEALYRHGEALLASEDELAEALTALHRAAEMGNVYAAYRLGELYEAGIDPDFFPPSCETAAEMYKIAAEGGYWVAAVHYGIDMYKAGRYTAATTILALAAEEGYEIAQANAAYLLEHKMGYDFPDADDLALRLYERAALQSPVYYYELASLMLRMEAEGRETSSVMVGPVTGVSQAVGYLEKAAELNNVRAIRKLAEMLETGVQGVIVQDAKRALRLYRKLLSLVSSPADSSSSSSSSEKNKDKHKINYDQEEKSVWAAFLDVTKLQFKITTLSAKTGLESVMKGGSGAEEGVPGGREWDPVMDSAREGL